MKSILLAACCAAIPAIALAGSPGSVGGRTNLRHNAAWARSHPVHAEYACKVPGKAYLVLSPTVCADGHAD